MPYPFAKNNLHSNGKTVRTTSAAGGRFYGGSAPCPLPKNRMECGATGLEKAIGVHTNSSVPHGHLQSRLPAYTHIQSYCLQT